MRTFLNTDRSLENYKKLLNSEYFVDKSLIIDKLNRVINTTDCYVCVTRPRRFGKSSVADMLGAYYSKAINSSSIFEELNVSSCSTFEANLNKYNVISISFNRIPDKDKSYEDYMDLIQSALINDIKEMYPKVEFKSFYNISDMLYATGEKFIFIFDEWDYIFSNNLFKEHQNDFLEFLRNLLKDQPYVSLAYMTGVLPIKKYSSGSALNMFDEYTILNDMIYGNYFGFLEEEVRELCNKQGSISFQEVREWYNGYITEEEERIYNPRSVVKALKNKKCKSYWTNTGAMDEVVEYLKYNTLDIRDDIIEMVSGEEIDITIDEEFRAGQGTPRNKKEIYSAMIVLGFLSYHDGYLRIPNRELMKEFEKALADESFGNVSKIIKNSRNLVKATVDGDTETVEKILHSIHNSEIPILQYNDENSLSCVLTLGYLAARDNYRIEREALSHLMNSSEAKGEFSDQAHTPSGVCSLEKQVYADFTFHPRRRNDTAFIVELKKDEKPEVALNQIRNKEYIEKFKSENSNRKVLGVAICYDSKEKEHHCLIEEL